MRARPTGRRRSGRFSRACRGTLYGPGKPDLATPLTIKGPSDTPIPAGTRLDIKVGTVSSSGHLVVRADDEIVFEKKFVCGPESKEGEKIVYDSQWKIYQNVYAQTETVTLPKAAKQITINIDDGDWITLDALTMQAPNAGASPYSLAFDNEWGKKRDAPLIFQPDVATAPWAGGDGDWINRKWLHEHQIVPWQQLGTQGVGIMVGEFGSFNQTPDDVTMRWMEDTLHEFKRANWGWCLLEPEWLLRHPRQQPARRDVRGLRGPQARREDCCNFCRRIDRELR